MYRIQFCSSRARHAERRRRYCLLELSYKPLRTLTEEIQMQQPVAKSNNGIIDALSDVFHGSLLEKIPARSLIIMSMVSKKLKELVDTAPKELDLWWVKKSSPSPTAPCLCKIV